MKKVILSLAAIVAMGMVSCTTVTKTATTVGVDTSIASYNLADLEVSSKKISFTYTPTSAELKGSNLKKCAVHEALKANGNADVLVAPEYVVKNNRTVTVTGYPATYKNFRAVKK